MNTLGRAILYALTWPTVPLFLVPIEWELTGDWVLSGILMLLFAAWGVAYAIRETIHSHP